MTEVVLGKLTHVFSIGSPDKEACAYAGIHVDTLYEYQRKHPAFSERKAALKANPEIRARRAVFNNLKDPKVAMWWLQKKVRDEFGSYCPGCSQVRREEAVEEEEYNGGVPTAEQIEQAKAVLGDDYHFIFDDDDETEITLTPNPKPIARTALQS